MSRRRCGYVAVALLGSLAIGGSVFVAPSVASAAPIDSTNQNTNTGASVLKFDFGAQTSTPAAGYTLDYGQAYDATRGFGWEDSTGAAKSFIGNGRQRTSSSDARLNSYFHMQLCNNGAAGVLGDARWEAGVANGTYDVTVGVGDPDYTDSVNVVRAEGVQVVNFTPSGDTRGYIATVSVTVTDGRLTLDQVGGTNTKIGFVDVTAPVTTTPTEPTPTEPTTPPTTTPPTTTPPTTEPGTPVDAATTVAKIDFGAQSSTAASGYTLDYGQAFDVTRGYGWQDSAGVAKSFVGNGRQRTSSTDARLNSYLHMQLRNNGAAGVLGSARWEQVVPNGTYTVTVGVGDPDFTDSRHVVRAEGTTVVNLAPTNAAKTATGTAEVTVTDGRLTLDSLGGENTKIGYVDITSKTVTPAPDTTAPDAVIDVSGTKNAAGNYVTSATFGVTASDASGIKSIRYTIGDGASQAYDAPFTLLSLGTNTVTMVVTDNAGNTKTVTQTVNIVAAGKPVINATATDDYALNGTRLVFSTVGWVQREAKNVTLTNTGTAPVSVNNMTITGTNVNAFKFASGQAKQLTIAANSSVTVPITFTPVKLMVNSAQLSITTNDPAASTLTVALGGLNPGAYEGNYEPSIQQISDAFGFTTNFGVTNSNQYGPNFLGTESTPVGEEIMSAYWTRADAGQAVNPYPMANYSGRGTGSKGPFGWYAKGTSTKNNLFYFPGGSDVSGGENQRLTPKIGSGGRTSFNTAATFGITDSSTWSDDTKNGTQVHNFRFYPAKDSAGNVIANTYIVGVELGLKNTLYKNWDYQDYVFLLTNVKPAGN